MKIGLSMRPGDRLQEQGVDHQPLPLLATPVMHFCFLLQYLKAAANLCSQVFHPARSQDHASGAKYALTPLLIAMKCLQA